MTTAAYIACVLYVIGFGHWWVEHELDPKLKHLRVGWRMYLALIWPIMAMGVIVIWIRIMYWPDKANTKGSQA